MSKVKLGQYYTMRNPFTHELVQAWWEEIPQPEQQNFVEPYAGSNNIIRLMSEAFPQLQHNQWEAYDIAPESIAENTVPLVPIQQRDSLKTPPQHSIIITNPPYLAKNSATRKGFKDIAFGNYQDLYEVCISQLLEHNPYVAAIIPESFISRHIFTERLYGIISITEQIFDDTEVPVCLALWVPQRTKDYQVYAGAKPLGYYRTMMTQVSLLRAPLDQGLTLRFNDPQGLLGLKAIDNTKSPSITFVPGAQIPSSDIKHTSRSHTRITLLNEDGSPAFTEQELLDAIPTLNEMLATYRAETEDVLLTSFKGLRADGRYRRRMDWRTASLLIRAWSYSERKSFSFTATLL